MRYLSCLGLILFIIFSGAAAGQSADDPETPVKLRTAVKPKENIFIGQQVILEVDVLAAGGWAQFKRIDDFSVAGAQIMRYESQGTRLSETHDGEDYSGQRYQFFLFPARQGTLHVPSIPVEVEVTRWGANAGKTSQQLLTPEATFQVSMPPGTEHVAGLISTPQLTATQKWDPDTAEFKVGEALKRTIVQKGRDISGMAFTPLKFDSMDGVSVYPAEARVDDQYNRGTLNGQRVEAVTYVFTAQGTVELPEITIAWWDLSHNKLQQTVLPALELNISPAPQGQATGAPATKARPHALAPGLIFSLVLLGALGVAAWYFRHPLGRFWTNRRQARQAREDYQFRRFTRAAESNDPRAAFNRLMAWLDQIQGGTARLDIFVEKYGGPPAKSATDSLQQALIAESGDWSGTALAQTMGAARKRWQRDQKIKRRATSLPVLNP